MRASRSTLGGLAFAAALVADPGCGGGGGGTIRANFVPLHGSWSSGSDETVGAYDPGAGTFFLRNTNSNGAPNVTFTFAPPP